MISAANGPKTPVTTGFPPLDAAVEGYSVAGLYDGRAASKAAMSAS